MLLQILFGYSFKPLPITVDQNAKVAMPELPGPRDFLARWKIELEEDPPSGPNLGGNLVDDSKRLNLSLYESVFVLPAAVPQRFPQVFDNPAQSSQSNL